MKFRLLSIALILATAPMAASAAKTKGVKGATPADAHAFVEKMNAEYKAQYLEANAAEWVAETYITDDTQMLTARANEAMLKWLSAKVDESRRFEKVAGIDPKDKRAIELLKLQTAMPAPKDPAHLTELTNLASKLTAAYGSGKYCKDGKDPKSCRNLDELYEYLAGGVGALHGISHADTAPVVRRVKAAGVR
jgi:peptidyl-dipeptidase A